MANTENMYNPAYNPFLLDYFGRFAEWLCSLDGSDPINVFQLSDKFLGEILHTFYCKVAHNDNCGNEKRFVASSKNYGKFKALIALPNGNRTARFGNYGLLYMKDQGVHKLIVSDKMQEIYFASMQDDGVNLQDCIKLAKEKFQSSGIEV
jgi:hypothetical protein